MRVRVLDFGTCPGALISLLDGSPGWTNRRLSFNEALVIIRPQAK
jgi:hypothetical protein